MNATWEELTIAFQLYTCCDVLGRHASFEEQCSASAPPSREQAKSP